MEIIKTREELIKLLPKNSVGAEIGVWKGQFSKILLDTVEPKMLYLIDPWEGDVMSGDKNGNDVITINLDDYFMSNIIPEFAFIHNCKVLQTTSAILTLFPDQHLDWIYIDGCHEYECIKYDLEVSLPKVKQGGYILGHDFNNDAFPGVVHAVNEFCFNNNLTIDYLTQDGCPSYLIKKL